MNSIGVTKRDFNKFNIDVDAEGFAEDSDGDPYWTSIVATVKISVDERGVEVDKGVVGWNDIISAIEFIAKNDKSTHKTFLEISDRVRKATAPSV
jgi:hypothetical protein